MDDSVSGDTGSFRRLGFILAIVIALADQATKVWALDGWFDPPRVIEVTPFFNLVAVWNRGEVLFRGTPQDILTHPDVIRDVMGGHA